MHACLCPLPPGASSGRCFLDPSWWCYAAWSLPEAATTFTTIPRTNINLKVSAVTTGGYTGLTAFSTGPLPTGVMGTYTPPAIGPILPDHLNRTISQLGAPLKV